MNKEVCSFYVNFLVIFSIFGLNTSHTKHDEL